MSEVEDAAGSDPRFDHSLDELKRHLSDRDDAEARARIVVELMAVVLQASLLLRHGDPAVADAFCGSRLDSHGGRTFGTLRPNSKLAGIVDRHRPQI